MTDERNKADIDKPIAGEGEVPTYGLEPLVHSFDEAELRSAATSESLTEDLALALLKRRDISSNVLQDLARNKGVARLPKVMSALVSHPRTPPHSTLPILKALPPFELMRLALAPTVPADVKATIERTLIARLSSLTSGERLTLARRGATKTAAALILDPEERVRDTALDNSRLIEAEVVKILRNEEANETLVNVIGRHAKWSVRQDVRIALLRNPKTSPALAFAIVRSLPAVIVHDALSTAELSESSKALLMAGIQS